MELAGKDEDPLPVDLEAIVVPFDDLVVAIVVERPLSRLLSFGKCRNTQKGKDNPKTGN